MWRRRRLGESEVNVNNQDTGQDREQYNPLDYIKSGMFVISKYMFLFSLEEDDH